MSYLFPDIPDPSLRQPATMAAIVPVFLAIYAQAVLAILPNTFILKLSLLPFIVWQACSCAIGLNFSMAVAKWLGFENDERFRIWNFQFAVAMLVMASRSFEWTFLIKQPLRKYELREGQDTPIQRPLSVTNVLLDALDLFFNQRGIGWPWSSRPFPSETTPPPSIASVLAKILLKITALTTSQYTLHFMRLSLDNTGDDSLFGATPPLLPRTILALFTIFVNAMFMYMPLALMHHVATLIGRVLLRQQASHWPPFFHQPWMATSLWEFWSVRWHQFFRHFLIVVGARPGGRLLGRRGAVMGAFAVSGLIHMVGWWATGRVTELYNEGGFYLLMGVGMILESEFERATGSRVRGWLGWLWTMGWILLWGSNLLDLRLEDRPFPIRILPDHLRSGKMFINGAISLFGKRG